MTDKELALLVDQVLSDAERLGHDVIVEVGGRRTARLDDMIDKFGQKNTATAFNFNHDKEGSEVVVEDDTGRVVTRITVD